MMRKKRVNIKYIAKEAGVSTQTVSRVINNEPHVAPDTRKRILNIINRLGYRPSQLARSLSHGRSGTLGVMGHGMKFYGPSRTFSGIEQEAVDLGYNLFLRLVRHPETQNLEELVDSMLSYHVEGIIWAVPEIANNRDWILPEIPKLPIPVVFINMEQHAEVSVVAVDNRKGGELATNHLLKQNPKNIGIITGPMKWWEARQRSMGWRNALERAGREISADLIVEGDWTPASGEIAMNELLNQRPDIDAVFASNDQMALGAIKAIKNFGMKIPDDIIIIGFDDIPEAPFFDPPLSTICQDITELGSSAVRELYRMIKLVQDSLPVTSSYTLLEPCLIIRESSVRTKQPCDQIRMAHDGESAKRCDH